MMTSIDVWQIVLHYVPFEQAHAITHGQIRTLGVAKAVSTLRWMAVDEEWHFLSQTGMDTLQRDFDQDL